MFAVIICGVFSILGFLLQPFKVPGQNIAYTFALLTLFVITLVGFALGSVDEVAPIGQAADPEQTREFGVSWWMGGWCGDDNICVRRWRGCDMCELEVIV